ncbi:MAG: hypothetical protein LUE88_02430 [Clostridiales bacterium]|nr:hypothetical protein [Clostridiales bacterium]
MSRRINRPLPYPYRDIFKNSKENSCADIEFQKEIQAENEEISKENQSDKAESLSSSSDENTCRSASLPAVIVFILLAIFFRNESTGSA